MKALTGSIKEDFDRDLYWTKIVFLSNDESKKSSVFVSASREYFEDFFLQNGSQSLNEEHLNDWLRDVVKKWESLGEEIFNHDVHYDVYANTKEGESNGLDYLLRIVQSS